MGPEFFLPRLERTAGAVHQVVADLTDDEAQRIFPPALAPVAWHVAHMATADGGVVARLGHADPRPQGWTERFTGDLKGGYPSVAEALEAFDRAHRLLLDAIETVPLGTRIEGSRTYATFGDALAFVAYHRGYHIGKVATLRAMLGKPRLFG